MRPLKETRRQIEATGEIKRRKEARLAQLRKEGQDKGKNVEKVSVVVDSDEEDSEDERPPTCVVCLRRKIYWRACVRLSCFLLLLFLLHCLNRIYHAPDKQQKKRQQDEL